MNIQSIDAYIFSPTGTTRKIVEAVADGMRPAGITLHDCTKSYDRQKIPLTSAADAVILGAPVYYGRLPESVVPVLRTLKGAGKPAVIIAVYGNREYDDALVELQDISAEQGFVPVAAGAFIGEHSYATPGRPLGLESPGAAEKLTLPGNRPYKTPENLLMLKKIKETVAFTPVTDPERCTQCEICVEVCPENAIDSCDVTDIDRWKCILCFACVKFCPEQAKSLPVTDFHAAIDKMAEANAARKEPVTFLAGG